ncbi:hypothetical protein D8682_26345 [Buttiauxella sp. 3AFRM03]|nr:hypothetical protein D8682_26345 [Buttiauxella sp. 3AFRM03]
MISLISIAFIPDSLKSRRWRLWEYRIIYRSLKRISGTHDAYKRLRMSIWVWQNIEMESAL